MQYQEQSKFGSTGGGIIVAGNTARVFWVGDVKILHYSKGKLCFESKAHNLSSKLSETDNQNRSGYFSKYNHIVTRSIYGDVDKSIPSYQELILKRRRIVYLF